MLAFRHDHAPAPLTVRGHCILSHGFESGPDATKVTALAEVAERLGWTHERPDYTDLDARTDVSRLGDVAARVARLQALAQAAAARGPLVLAGSSLGAWISGQVSLRVPVRAVFQIRRRRRAWAGAAAAGRGGADLDRARLARRTDRGCVVNGRAPRDPVAGGRQHRLGANVRPPRAARRLLNACRGVLRLLRQDLSACSPTSWPRWVARHRRGGQGQRRGTAVAQRAVLWSRLAAALWPWPNDWAAEQALTAPARCLAGTSMQA